jgi:hypothetical protein
MKNVLRVMFYCGCAALGWFFAGTAFNQLHAGAQVVLLVSSTIYVACASYHFRYRGVSR